MYIEVKSTKSEAGDANFFISANELERAKNDENYWIYIVYEAHTNSPKIWKLNNPFMNNKEFISLTPVSYKVRINVE